MPTNYPGALDTTTELPNNRADGTTSATNHPQDHDNLSDAVRAIEGELGTLPKGGSADVKTRLNGVDSSLALKAPLASPTFTGTPAAPTAAQGTNTTQLATTAYVQTETGLLIPKSLVDAKGDLLVGTADNTVARKAVGSNGQVLLSDSADSSGVRWGHVPMQVAGVIGGWYAATPHSVQGLANQTIAVGTATMGAPTVYAHDLTIDQIGCYVQTAGGAGALIRMAVLSPDRDNPYGITLSTTQFSLLADTGTTPTTGAATSVGRVKFTLGTPLVIPAGTAFSIAAAVQGTGGSVGIYHENISQLWAGPWGSDDIINGERGAVTRTGVTGAFPAPFIPTAFFTGGIGGAGSFHRSA